MLEFTHGDSMSPHDGGSASPHPASSPDLEDEGSAHHAPIPRHTPHEEAARALNQLRAALATHGLTVPSLGLDVVSLSQPYARPLIELGRINLGTAHLLTQALNGTDTR